MELLKRQEAVTYFLEFKFDQVYKEKKGQSRKSFKE